MKNFIAIALFILPVFVSCKHKKAVVVNNDEYYTCSMHPQIRQDKPGTCPICHMELIQVKKTQQSEDEIALSEVQMSLGNIQTDTIRNGEMGEKVVVTATLSADETKVNSINARIGGRIDKLYFRNADEYVQKGAHLYDLYSEELNTAKQEYIAALERQQIMDNSVIDFGKLLQSAKTKLLLWGVTEAQIDELAKSKKASPLTAFYSSVSGYISAMPVTEGQFVMEGGTVMKLTDLSTIWVESQVYASQLSTLDYSGGVTVQLPDLPGKEFKGKVEIVNPEINPDTRVNLIRVALVNQNNIFKPGMPAYVTFKSLDRKTLSLPSDAVLRDGKMATIWVETGTRTFKSKMVETGMESGSRIEIKSGLQEGDIVVTSGAYLLQSEYIFKRGNNTMAGHDMKSMQ